MLNIEKLLQKSKGEIINFFLSQPYCNRCAFQGKDCFNESCHEGLVDWLYKECLMEDKCKDCKYNFSFLCIGCGENRVIDPEQDACEMFEPRK